jgi:hypothetical protein
MLSTLRSYGQSLTLSFRSSREAGLRRLRFPARFARLPLGDDLQQRLVRDLRIHVIGLYR